MVFVILLQVFFRYLLNNAMPWPDEAARFLMLWMIGVIAPLAYREGGFVAIDMLGRALPKLLSSILTFFLLLFSAVILIYSVKLGWAHTMGFAGNFNSASLRIPLEWFDMGTIKMKLRFMYASLLVCFTLMISVNIELLLRTFIDIFRPDMTPPEPDSGISSVTEAS